MPLISLERMAWDGVGEVRYRLKWGHENSGAPVEPVETFDPLEFLARVIMHIPEPRRHPVRYYGAYSNASRGKRRLREEDAEVSNGCSRGEFGFGMPGTLDGVRKQIPIPEKPIIS